MKEMLKAAVGIVLALVLLVVGISTWVYFQSRYFNEAYKPAQTVAKNDQERLRQRGGTYPCHDFELFLEWNPQGDSGEGWAGPYRFIIAVTPNVAGMTDVKVTGLTFQSSLGTEYAFDKPAPFDLGPSSGGRFGCTSDTLFDLQFDANEEITTTVTIEYKVDGEQRSQTLKERWVPVRVEMHAPIVQGSIPGALRKRAALNHGQRLLRQA